MPGALAGPEGVEPSTAGLGDRGATMARAFANNQMLIGPRMTECADLEAGLEAETRRFGYQLMPGLPSSAIPAHAGLA